MVNSRQKGARGERELAEKLRERGYDARRGQQFCGANGDPDVVSPDLPLKLHWEVKRVEKFNLYDAMEQASGDCQAKHVPIVAHKKNHKEWVVVLRLDDFLDILKELE